MPFFDLITRTLTTAYLTESPRQVVYGRLSKLCQRRREIRTVSRLTPEEVCCKHPPARSHISVHKSSWDQHNLKKIQAHGIKAVEVEQALSISPVIVYEQDADGESRYVYYGETAGLRLLAVVLTERDGKIRVITAYELDAGQKRDYLERRMRGE